MLYPPVVPHRTGLLDVGDGHHVYWEVSGHPEGWPVVVLHGGPGGGCTDRSRRWFHPDYFRIVTFDQRGCGRSTPHAGIEHNTTQHLVSDLESLRVVLGIDRWVLMGRSWGATLALAYAEQHPNRVDAIVVSGVFTARRFELDWLYSADVARACYRLLTCGTAAAQRAAARAWCAREDAVASTVSTPAALDDRTALARARIGAHYFLNRYFLVDGQLLVNADRLRGIPGVIVQGRDDAVTPSISACDLHGAWPESRLEIVDEAGHSSADSALMRALVDATDSLLPIAQARVARAADGRRCRRWLNGTGRRLRR
jgi:proline iminopeptidase